ncbi:DUF3109 family protein [Brevibacillus laterosporus]|uniref:DUF3109 domain-containing protein n=1 Tax=Brevibacillus laterosporus TaxID=1465 RepID=A0AAP8Q9S9_BRELA|nr:DUF3109 family protein [Brevibacillus laterosporus]PPA91452.1 DUF3109 domain-containing protein [Brevibacillus laterosporus]
MRNDVTYGYYGTTERMSQKESYHFHKYVKKKKNRLVQKGHFYIDVDALQRPCHLDCFNCHIVHRETCCENGQPYAVQDWQLSLIEAESRSVAAAYLNGRSQQRVMEHGCFESAEPGVVRMEKGSCLFYGQVDGQRCCLLHAHGLREQKDVYSIKPFSCQLYPIDFVMMDNENILITALTEETASFSRWGHEYLEIFYCANQEKRKQATHIDEQLFSLDGYQPAYIWGRELIERSFGEDAYQSVIEAIYQYS